MKREDSLFIKKKGKHSKIGKNKNCCLVKKNVGKNIHLFKILLFTGFFTDMTKYFTDFLAVFYR